MVGSIKSVMSPKFKTLTASTSKSTSRDAAPPLVDTWVCYGGWGSKGTGNRKKANWKWLELGCVLEELSTLPASLLALKKGMQRKRMQIDGH